MVCSISPNFSDELLISNLRCQFDYEEMFDMDFQTVFNQIVDRGDDLFLNLRNRNFSIDKVTGAVSEVKS